MQFSDKLIYEGSTYVVEDYLLEEYFAKFKKKKPKSDVICTALSRGYIAYFEIKENQLFIKDIKVLAPSTQPSDTAITNTGKTIIIPKPTFYKSVIDDVFPNQDMRKLNFLNRIVVISSHGFKILNSQKRNFIKVFEINSGNVTNQFDTDSDGYYKFKKEQFKLYKVSKDYPIDLKKGQQRNKVYYRRNKNLLKKENIPESEYKTFEIPQSKAFEYIKKFYEK